METGETPSLGPSRCFALLILSFALCLANLYEVPLLKCESDGKGLHIKKFAEISLLPAAVWQILQLELFVNICFLLSRVKMLANI